MGKILLTGNSGFIASHLVNNLPLYKGMDLKDGKDILEAELPDVDTIIHLAAQTSVIESTKDPVEDAKNNILGTIRLANHYKDKKFIFASSGGAIQETIESPYGLSKYCAEEYIKLLCKDYVILRLPNIYGKGSNSVVDKFKNGEVNIFGDGSATRDYLHVSDLVRVIKESLDWPKGTYSLGTGVNTSVWELARATGKKVHYKEKNPGELQHSYVANSIGLVPETNVLDYIRSQDDN